MQSNVDIHPGIIPGWPGYLGIPGWPGYLGIPGYLDKGGIRLSILGWPRYLEIPGYLDKGGAYGCPSWDNPGIVVLCI